MDKQNPHQLRSDEIRRCKMDVMRIAVADFQAQGPRVYKNSVRSGKISVLMRDSRGTAVDAKQ